MQAEPRECMRPGVVAWSRKLASSSMLSESRSIFAMPAPVFLWLPGRCGGHKDGTGLIHNHNPITRLPKSRPNRSHLWARDANQKRMGMTKQQDAAALEREEIAARVAIFKATQERFKREREEYFVTTLENARGKSDRPPFWS